MGEWAASLGLAHHVLDWEGPKPETGLQAKAREARYGLMAGWCRANAAGLLLTGHTLDDQAETVLMRLSRTLSPDSLVRHPAHGNWDGLALLPPAARGQAGGAAGLSHSGWARTGSRTRAMPTGVSSGCGCARTWPSSAARA